MKTTTLIATVAITLGLLISVPSADAKKPLDVACDDLAIAIECADQILDLNNVEFDSLGDLVSSAILDEAVFALLQSLILFCSGGAIDFDSASQAISTTAQCGLLPQLIGEVNDGP